MRNIWFTIYTGSIEEYQGIANYRTLLETLLISAIQDKINREKKVQKYMLMFSKDIESDDINLFKNLHFERKIRDGIVSLYISTKYINWNNFSENEKKDFLIEKWKVLFDNLSDDYFLTDKSKVLESLNKLKALDWRLRINPIKKKVKYNQETYTVIIELSNQQARLMLVRDSDESWALLKDYDTFKIKTDINFKSFKIEGDILTFSYSNVYNSLFSPPETFNLKKVFE